MSNEESYDGTPFKCLDLEKYDKMGVTPQELFYRQNGLCYLTIAYDDLDGTKEFGELYCTDGVEYAPTGSMLNPTFECARCMSNFVALLLENHVMERKLDSKIVSLLTALSKSKSLQDGDPVFSMSKETFDAVEEHLGNTTLFSNETNPLRVSASAEILLFGSPVEINDSLDYGTVNVTPGGLIVLV